MLRTRLWTTAVALPAALAAIILPPRWLFELLVVALGLFSLYEVGTMTGSRSAGRLLILAVGGAVPLVAMLVQQQPIWIGPALVITAMFALIALVAAGSHSRWRPRAGALTLLGALYVGILYPFLALVRNRPGGIALLVLVFLLVVASDSGAYFAGTLLGRTRLAPRVSPNKTVEGAAGGLAASLLGGLLLGPLLVPRLGIGQTVLVALVTGVLAQLGDLSGSAFKRTAAVKDSGWLFPGHGGLVDRTSSLLFAIVFAYYYPS